MVLVYGRFPLSPRNVEDLLFRRRERAMLRFRQMRTLQKFASVHANVHNHFNPNATSLVARATSSAAPPRWWSGRRSPADPSPTEPEVHRVETGSR